MVLTDNDFGRAYLRERATTEFLFKLYEEYTVLFVGYSHSDIIMNYLIKSLTRNPQSLHYALIGDRKDADNQHVVNLEIETIPYPQHEEDHRELDKAINKLAEHLQRREVEWHSEISAIAEKRPCELNEEEKGTFRLCV